MLQLLSPACLVLMVGAPAPMAVNAAAPADATVAFASAPEPSRADPPGPATPPADPRTQRLLRVDLVTGAVWRIRQGDTWIASSVELGREHGLSGSFHVGMLLARDRNVIGVLDFPIGAGVVQRWRLGARDLYLSVGLTAGILVHRADTDLGLLHRVDPDFRVPLRFAWTAWKVGVSVVLEQGYSVRSRTYERRGVEVWSRIPYRVGFAVGLHFDAGIGQARPRRTSRRSGEVP